MVYRLLGLLFLHLMLCTPSLAQGAPTPRRDPLLWDRDLSARVGAAGLLTLHGGLGRIEDRLVGTRWFCETNTRSRLAGVVLRQCKFLFLDRIVDHGVVSLQHEYFGHGSVLRDLGYENYHYQFHPARPYGDGVSGITMDQPQSADRLFSDAEAMVYASAGMASSSVMAQDLRLRWLERRRIDYREAALYLRAIDDLMNTVLQTDPDLARNPTGSDIVRYLNELNTTAGHETPAEYRVSVRDLKNRTLINLADPFLFFALATHLKTYLWEGNRSATLPLFRIGSVHYMPALRMVLTPFGPEYYFENFATVGRRSYRLYFRVGEPILNYLWGGSGLTVQRILDRRSLVLDAAADIWGQPSLKFGGDSISPSHEGFGAAIRLRASYSPSSRRWPIGLLGEVGYKTDGFLEGYGLDAGVTLMLGFTLNDSRSRGAQGDHR